MDKDIGNEQPFDKLLSSLKKINPLKFKPYSKESLQFNRYANIFLIPLLKKKLFEVENSYYLGVKKLDLSNFKSEIAYYEKAFNINFSLGLEESLSFLSTLVYINTTNSQNGEIFLAFFESYLKKKGNYPKKIIKVVNKGIVSKAYLWEKNKNLPWVVINTHYDVIPPKSWKRAFEPRTLIEDNKLFLYGRGSNDNKFGFLAFILVLEELMKLDVNICFTAVGDEEKGGDNGSKILLNKLFNLLKDKKLFGIVLEPTASFPLSLKIGIRKKADLIIEFKGEDLKPSAKKKGGIIPFIYLLSKYSIESEIGKAPFNKDENDAELKEEIKGRFTLMSIKSLEVYESVGANPGRGKIHLFFRFYPKKDFSSIEFYIHKAAEKSKVEIEKTFYDIDDRGFIDLNVSYQQHFINAISKILKISKRQGVAFRTIGGGGSDAKYFNLSSLPVVEFGVNPYNIHSRNEKVDVIEIYLSSLILLQGIKNFVS